MKYRIVFILFTISIFQLACSEPREKTTTGAATGGLVGAGLGAIVGNQVGNTGEGLVLGALAGAGTGATVGNAFDGQDAIMRNQDEAIERQERMISAQQSEMEELRKLSQDQISFKGDLHRELSATSNASNTNNNNYNPAAGYKWPDRPRGEVRRVENSASSLSAQNLNKVNAMPPREIAKPVVATRNTVPANPSLASTRLAERDLTPSAQMIPDRPLPLNDNTSTNKGSYSWRDASVKDSSQSDSVGGGIQQKFKAITQVQIESDPVDSAKIDDQSVSANPIAEQPIDQVASVGNNDCAQGSNEARMAVSASETADKLFHYRRALRFCPDNADFHNGLGEVYISLNRAEDARYEFQEALRINPSHSAARANLSNL
jgi:tetratricopeptide (TPR) repeat protein